MKVSQNDQASNPPFSPCCSHLIDFSNPLQLFWMFNPPPTPYKTVTQVIL